MSRHHIYELKAEIDSKINHLADLNAVILKCKKNYNLKKTNKADMDEIKETTTKELHYLGEYNNRMESILTFKQLFECCIEKYRTLICEFESSKLNEPEFEPETPMKSTTVLETPLKTTMASNSAIKSKPLIKINSKKKLNVI